MVWAVQDEGAQVFVTWLQLPFVQVYEQEPEEYPGAQEPEEKPEAVVGSVQFPMVVEGQLLGAQMLPFQVPPGAQEVVTVLEVSSVLPLNRLKTVCGYADHTWRPGAPWFAAVESVAPVLPSFRAGAEALDVVHVA